jgi:hypothetical protein
MMRLHFLSGILLAAASLSSCTKSHDIQNSVNILASNEVIGSWKVTSYTDSGIDKTNDLASVNIQFNSNLTTLLTCNDTTVNGTWAIKPQDGLDQLNITVLVSSSIFKTFQATWYVLKTNEGFLNLTYGVSPAVKKISLQRL